MSDFRKWFALALALSLVAMVSPALAQEDTTALDPALDPSSSSLTEEEEEEPPPDDGDEDFDEWNSDVLNQTSPSFDAPTFDAPSYDPPSSAEPSATLGAPVGWLNWLRSWWATGTR